MSKPDEFDIAHRDYVVIERDVLQDNIILFDAKCAILLAFAGVVLVRCIDKFAETATQLSTLPSWYLQIALAFYGLAIVGFAATVFLSWQVVKPRIIQGTDIFNWASQAFKGDLNQYSAAVHETETGALKRDMLRLLHNLARICNAKYVQFRRTARIVEASTVFAVLAELLRLGGMLAVTA